MQQVAQLLLMCDGHDIGISIDSDEDGRRDASGAAEIFVYDNYPGGIGFSEPLFRMHGELLDGTRRLIAECECENGCPGCVGPSATPGRSRRSAALRILDLLLSRPASRRVAFETRRAAERDARSSRLSALADRIRGIVGARRVRRSPRESDRRHLSLPAVRRHRRGRSAAPGGAARRALLRRRAALGAVGAPRHGADRRARGAARPRGGRGAAVCAGGSSARPPFVFFDLETTGLSGGAGTLAFLVGCGWFDRDGSFVTRQFLLARHADERVLLEAVAAELARAGALVSFNGKSFDAPLLEGRYLFHRSPGVAATCRTSMSSIPRGASGSRAIAARPGCAKAVQSPRRPSAPAEPARVARFRRSSARSSARGGTATCRASRFPDATSSSSAAAIAAPARAGARAQPARSAVAGGADGALASTWRAAVPMRSPTRARRSPSATSTRAAASTSGRAQASAGPSTAAARRAAPTIPSGSTACARWRSPAAARGGTTKRPRHGASWRTCAAARPRSCAKPPRRSPSTTSTACAIFRWRGVRAGQPGGAAREPRPSLAQAVRHRLARLERKDQ